jgi:hypothetical protein
MTPSAIDPAITDIVELKDNLDLPKVARARLEVANIDLSPGYPYRPLKPLYLQDIYNIRNEPRKYVDPDTRADPDKIAYLSVTAEVTDSTTHIGTEIVRLQLKALTIQQKDELGLLIAERSVIFFKDQTITPQQQKKLGEWYGEIEIHMCSLLSYVMISYVSHTKNNGVPIRWPHRAKIIFKQSCDNVKV